MAGVVLAADLLDEDKISSRQLKQLFDVCFEKGEDFAAVYEREKPEQITDASAIEALIDQVIAANPKQVEQYRAGKKTMAGFFVGQVMKAIEGPGQPGAAQRTGDEKAGGVRPSAFQPRIERILISSFQCGRVLRPCGADSEDNLPTPEPARSEPGATLNCPVSAIPNPGLA